MRAPADFSLRQTVGSHGWSGIIPFLWDARLGSLQTAGKLGDGSLHHFSVRQPGGKGGAIRICWLSGAPSAGRRRQLKDKIRRMLSLDLDLSEFHSLCRGDPRLGYVPRVGAGRFLRCGGVFEEVFKAICATNIAWRQAVAAMNRLALLGESLPGGVGRVFPSPSRILRIEEARLREISRLGYRVPYLRSWARRVQSGTPEVAAIEAGKLGPEEIKRFLLSVPGVGKATTRYLMMVWGHGEEISVDSSVYLYCRLNRFAGRIPSEREILALYEPFGVWKAHAYWFEFLPWAKTHYQL